MRQAYLPSVVYSVEKSDTLVAAYEMEGCDVVCDGLTRNLAGGATPPSLREAVSSGASGPASAATSNERKLESAAVDASTHR